MRALNDFDIDLRWNFKKVSSAYPVEKTVGTIYCDLGGCLTSGIIDPHGKGHLSAAAAVFAMPHLVLNHLLGPLNEAFNAGQSVHCNELTFTFVVNRNHWDALCCFVLCDHLVRTGKLPDWTFHLVESANMVDHGKILLSESHSTAPLLLFYSLQNKAKGDLAGVFREGLDLINKVGYNQQTLGHNPFFCSIPKEDIFSAYFDLAKYNEEDLKIFENDLKEADVFKVFLPSVSNESSEFQEKEVTCLMFLRQPLSKLFVHWSRIDDKYDLLVAPTYEGSTKTIQKWTISVNPKAKINLRRLGYLLEKEEKKQRIDDLRKGSPRWDDDEYSDNSDPWYDGRDHDFTLVESPRSGTFLQDAVFIKDILQSRFYGVSLKAKSEEEVPQTHLLSYLFFEFDCSSNHILADAQPSKPFKNLIGGYSYIKEIEFLEPAKADLYDCLPDSSQSQLKLYFSEVTEHAVLEIETILNAEINILEDVEKSIQKWGQDAVEIGKRVEEKFSLESKIWGSMNFFLLVFIDPDLSFHDETRLRKLFEKLTKSSVSSEEISSLKNRSNGEDLLSNSASVCVLRQSEQDRLDENRRLIAFYSLFIKSSYRRFSQLLEPLTRGQEIVDAKDEILNIQMKFSRFLAAYDFSGTEISFDGGITKFFNTMANSLALEEQKKETNIEIQLIGNLSSSLENRERIKQNKRLNLSIFVLSLLAVCDFLYALSSDIYQDYLDALPKFGITISFLLLIGSISSFFLYRRTKTLK